MNRLLMNSYSSLLVGPLALVLLSTAHLAAGNPGDLDATFGTRGAVVTPLSASASAVLLQPDGNLVAVGGTGGSSVGLAVARYNADGTLDSSFGTGGTVVTLVGDQGCAVLAFGPTAVLQNDGKILVATASIACGDGVSDRLTLVRYRPDGLLDDGFGVGGIVVVPVGQSVDGQVIVALRSNTVLIELDGKPVISAHAALQTGFAPGALIRFNLDGSLDSSFGTGGIKLLGPPNALINGVFHIDGVATAQPDGKFIVAGEDQIHGGWAVGRFDPSGALDPGFGVGGVAPVLASLAFAPISAMLVQPDGKIVLSGRGEYLVPPGLGYALVAARLNPDGTADSGFAGGEGAITPMGQGRDAGRIDPFGPLTAIALQADGKLVQAGTPFDGIADFHIGLVRYNPDGTLDSGFGGSGIVMGPVGSTNAVAVQPDDKLVVGGSTSSGFQLARFWLSGGTSVSLTTSPNPSSINQPVTFSATVSGHAPTGNVQFLDGSNGLPGCESVALVASIVSSQASCSTAALTAGAHALTVTYASDALNPPGFSPTLIQVVSAPGTNVAVEYYYGPWNHYFITSQSTEIAALDAGVFPGWQRTGESFAVYPDGTAQTRSMCRFFSGQSFAPKSSHFYTPYQLECSYVQRQWFLAWGFEGNVTPVQLADTFGNCPAGARPLYRLYNNGQGEAPNHRYTTSLTTRAAMISQGWIPEGAGTIGVACVPG